MYCNPHLGLFTLTQIFYLPWKKQNGPDVDYNIKLLDKSLILIPKAYQPPAVYVGNRRHGEGTVEASCTSLEARL